MFEDSPQFLGYLQGWLAGLPTLSAGQVFARPQNTAVLAVDVINGFCHAGPLASPRVEAMVSPIVSLFELAWKAGVRSFLLPQDTHDPQAVEFSAWPPHCAAGTDESATVPELAALPFADTFTIFPKNSIHSALNTQLPGWVDAHPDVTTYIVTGDCTDLCTYQLAMHLRLDANARQLSRRVLLPADCVDTYDMPLAIAAQVGAMPHPAELLHAVFLYHMALNGVEVIAGIRS